MYPQTATCITSRMRLVGVGEPLAKSMTNVRFGCITLIGERKLLLSTVTKATGLTRTWLAPKGEVSQGPYIDPRRSSRPSQKFVARPAIIRYGGCIQDAATRNEPADSRPRNTPPTPPNAQASAIRPPLHQHTHAYAHAHAPGRASKRSCPLPPLNTNHKTLSLLLQIYITPPDPSAQSRKPRKPSNPQASLHQPPSPRTPSP